GSPEATPSVNTEPADRAAAGP
ncbi:MAG: hypothetical protein QOK26_2111, partial [Pseudonocardiales bacterium]|nr:hypothetical protein [Pseudonocardiales bacterium]